MNRFQKEMRKRVPCVSFDADMYGNKEAFCREEDALVIIPYPGITEIMRFNRDGTFTDLDEDDYPEISAPYLVHLCGGDIERAKRILKSQHF